MEEKEQKFKEKKIKELPFKYTTEVSQELETLYTNVKKFLIDVQAYDFASFKQRSLMKSFLGITTE